MRECPAPGGRLCGGRTAVGGIFGGSPMDSHQSDGFTFKAPRSKFYSFLMRDWPYLLMLALALAGVARTSIGPSAMASYWVVLAPVFGIICIAEHWRDVEGPQ